MITLNSPLLTVEEAAQLLGISPITLRGRKRIKKYKDLPSVLIGRNLYFSLKDIDDLIQGKFVTDSMKAQESIETTVELKGENPDSIVIVDDANLDVDINLIE